jgi:sensor histidine kinase YesM
MIQITDKGWELAPELAIFAVVVLTGMGIIFGFLTRVMSSLKTVIIDNTEAMTRVIAQQEHITNILEKMEKRLDRLEQAHYARHDAH